MNKKILLAGLLVAFLSMPLTAQRRYEAYENYIRQYAPMAVDQMKRHKIPASITLAQGLLESGAGNSELALRSNNHFGIKCGGRWNGRSVRADDDARNECFRSYDNVAKSYEDHSLFLTSNARYAGLFRLAITDYRGWAKGLKRAGYATDPSYANRLITIIEDYELYKYDTKSGMRSVSVKDINQGYVTPRGSGGQGTSKYSQRQLRKKPWLANPHQVYIANDLAYVVARNGDSFKMLGKEFGISGKKLARFNDLQEDYTLMDGDIVYLKQKNTKHPGSTVYYEVQDGDSMHSISQKFGIRLKNLYKLNDLPDDYIPEVGNKIWVK